MSDSPQNKKKVVKATAEAHPAPSGGATWQASSEAKSKALTKRIISAVLWIVAIALQAFAIFGLLNAPTRTSIANARGWSTGITQGADGQPVSAFPGWALWTIIGILVINLIIVVIANLMWKAANRLDPASEREKFRFFIQNQLGAIMSIIAFLPLIILIFTNKDMDKKQKSIAGIVGVVALLIAAIVGVDFNPPSVEQYTAEQNWDRTRVEAITGADSVYWVQSGNVYHLCAEVSPLQNSTQAEILNGTVAQATADTSGGMERLTKQVQMEINQCNAAGHDFSLPDQTYLDHEPPAGFVADLENAPTEGAETEDSAE